MRLRFNPSAPARRNPSHRMQPGTKLALTIAAVAIATGLTIKAVRAASRRKAES